MVTQSHPQDVLRKLEEGIVICQPGCGGPRLVSLDNGLDARYVIIDLSLMDALAPHLHKVPNKDNIKPLWVGSFTVTAERSRWSMAQSWEHGAAGASDHCILIIIFDTIDRLISLLIIEHCIIADSSILIADTIYYWSLHCRHLIVVTIAFIIDCRYYCWSYCPFGTTTIDHWLLQIYHWYYWLLLIALFRWVTILGAWKVVFTLTTLIWPLDQFGVRARTSLLKLWACACVCAYRVLRLLNQIKFVDKPINTQRSASSCRTFCRWVRLRLSSYLYFAWSRENMVDGNCLEGYEYHMFWEVDQYPFRWLLVSFWFLVSGVVFWHVQ